MGKKSTYRRGAAAPDGKAQFSPESARIARGLCKDAAAQPTSLMLEQWASMLLGTFWERRELAKEYRVPDPAALVGEPFIAAIARIGSRNAKLALLTLARIDRGMLGLRANDLADGLKWTVPPRVKEVGTARLVEAFVASSPRDGDAVLFRSDGEGPLGHMLAVFIDARLHGIAKHLALVRPDALEEMTDDRLKFRPADLHAMRLKVAQAIEKTDAAAKPPVSESFSRYRAIAVARLSPLMD